MDFDMGKYGLFVWGSYGLSALGLVTLTILSLRARARRAQALADFVEAMNTRKTQDTPSEAPPEAPAVSKERSA